MNELFDEEETLSQSPVDRFCIDHQILVTRDPDTGEYAAAKTLLFRSTTKLQAVYALARNLKLIGAEGLVA